MKFVENKYKQNKETARLALRKESRNGLHLKEFPINSWCEVGVLTKVCSSSV